VVSVLNQVGKESFERDSTSSHGDFAGYAGEIIEMTVSNQVVGVMEGRSTRAL
jgi:hypothetical protein